MLRWAFQMTLVEPLSVPCDVAEDGLEAVHMVEERMSHGEPPYLAVIMDNQVRSKPAVAPQTPAAAAAPPPRRRALPCSRSVGRPWRLPPRAPFTLVPPCP